MIAQRAREGKRAKALKIAKLYKEGKCRECSVVVTRMDFAKILGKFTKVKIQYESSTPSSPKNTRSATPKSNGRLKNNENGMIQALRSRSNETPIKSSQRQRELKNTQSNKVTYSPKQQKNNILKENNVLKKAITPTSPVTQVGKKSVPSKKYGIIFSSPKNKDSNELKSKSSLVDMLPKINNIALPSSEWCIDYFPKLQEPKDDKVYERIAAELEDLMKTEKPQVQDKISEKEADANKADEFPSIMDILNDTTSANSLEQKDQSSIEFKSNLDPSTTLDVEAMLLGKTEESVKDTPMDVDSSEVECNKKLTENNNSYDDNPGSPSILNEPSAEGSSTLKSNDDQSSKDLGTSDAQSKAEGDSNSIKDKNISSSDSPHVRAKSNLNLPMSKLDSIVYLIFKKIVDGKCLKSVLCPKNLKYNIELGQKSVELIGAPKFISTLDDLQVLLQIVNESESTSSYIQCL